MHGVLSLRSASVETSLVHCSGYFLEDSFFHFHVLLHCSVSTVLHGNLMITCSPSHAQHWKMGTRGNGRVEDLLGLAYHGLRTLAQQL